MTPQPRVTCSAGGPLPQGWLRAGGSTCEDENALGQRASEAQHVPKFQGVCICSHPGSLNIFNLLANLPFSVLWDSKNGSAFRFNCGMLSLLTHYCAASESLH